MNDDIQITEMWIDPAELIGIHNQDTGDLLADIYPDGMFVRMVTGGEVLSVVNATREQANGMMNELSLFHVE